MKETNCVKSFCDLAPNTALTLIFLSDCTPTNTVYQRKNGKNHWDYKINETGK